MPSDHKVQVGSRGVGFCGLLFIVFFVLKMGVGETAVVGWSWWWVTAPLWGGLALLFVGLALIAAGLGSVMVIASLIDFVRKHLKNHKG